MLGPIPPNTLHTGAIQRGGSAAESETESLLQVALWRANEPDPRFIGPGAMNHGSGSCRYHRQSEVLGRADLTPRTKPPNTKQPEEKTTKTAPKPTPKPHLSQPTFKQTFTISTKIGT